MANWIDRFWAKVAKNGPIHSQLGTACWVWMASKNQQGYGWFGVPKQVSSDGKAYTDKAHRVSFFLAHGRWPEPMALHKCDNKSCVRPIHLFEGDHVANMADKVVKGLANKPWLGKKFTEDHKRAIGDAMKSPHLRELVS